MNHLGLVRRGTRYAIVAFQGICAYHLFAENVASIHTCSGISMFPRFRPAGEWIIAEHLSHRMNPPNIARGDMIAAFKPTDPSMVVSKRVLGISGDTICVDPTGEEPWKHVVVPEGHIWLQGDNHANSTDSRDYGPVPMGLVQGKVIVKLTPSPTTRINPAIFLP